MPPTNPFAPTFGAAPPVLAGRDDIFADHEAAWTTGPTHPSYTTLLIGRRGSGKTVVLEALRALGGSRGWLSISEAAATPGLLDRLAMRAYGLLNRHVDEPHSDVKGDLSAAGIRLGADSLPAFDEPSLGLEALLRALASHLVEAGTGVLITVDELHAGETNELRALGIVVQNVTRIGRLPVAFVGAGLPMLEDTLLADTNVTFLQRCAQHEIGLLDPAAVWTALSEAVKQHGGHMGPAALSHAVDVSQGYPFLVQLVGFHAWEAAADPTVAVTLDDALAGAEIALHRVGRLVVAPMWRDLAEGSRRFLAAVAMDDGPSRTSDIAARLGVSSAYVGTYRHRLMRSGMVTSAGHGRLDFVLSATREWIRGLDEFPLLCETLQLSDRTPVGFTRPVANSQPEN